MRKHITILNDLRTIKDKNWEKGVHLLYYYFGNFFHPIELHGSDVGRVKREIRKFKKENKLLIQLDREDPDYMTLPELFDFTGESE